MNDGRSRYLYLQIQERGNRKGETENKIDEKCGHSYVEMKLDHYAYIICIIHDKK